MFCLRVLQMEYFFLYKSFVTDGKYVLEIENCSVTDGKSIFLPIHFYKSVTDGKSVSATD